MDRIAPLLAATIVKNPSTESTYTTGERTIVLGGSASGASLVTWVDEANELSGEAYVSYADWGVGSWFTDQIGLTLGSNRLVVSARRNGVTAPACVIDSPNVEYVPDTTGSGMSSRAGVARRRTHSPQVSSGLFYLTSSADSDSSRSHSE